MPLRWLIAVAIGAAACASPGSGQTPTPRALTATPGRSPAQPADGFRVELDIVCTEARERLVPLLENLELGNDVTEYPQQGQTLDLLADEVRDVVRRLAGLQPPSEAQQAFQARLQRSRDVVKAFRATAVALYARDLEQAREIARENGIPEVDSVDVRDLLPTCDSR